MVVSGRVIINIVVACRCKSIPVSAPFGKPEILTYLGTYSIVPKPSCRSLITDDYEFEALMNSLDDYDDDYDDYEL